MMERPKPKPGTLPLNPNSREDSPPSWAGIDPAVRKEHELRLAAYEARLADPDIQAKMATAVVAAQTALTPWGEEPPEPEPPAKPTTTNLKKLKAARKKVEEYSAVLRTAAFDDWVRRCLIEAENPREWTRAAPLYESYLRHAAIYGTNRSDKRLVKEELATETAWGKMMGSLFGKKRRRAGQYYPLRLKRGA